MASTAVELVIALTAKDAASSVLRDVGKKIEGLGAAGKLAVAGIAAAGTAAAATAGTLFALGEHAAEVAGEIRKLSRETGLSAEETSKLRYAAERLNISTDQISKGLGLFSKSLSGVGEVLDEDGNLVEVTSAKLDKYGISVMENADHTVNMKETLMAVATQFASMPDGVEKTAEAMALFGKGGKDLIPLLNQGSKGLASMGDEATKLGLVFSQDGLESARKFGLAQKDLSDRFEGMKLQIGMKVLPILTQFFDFLSSVADKVLPPVTALVERLIAIFTEVFDVLTGRAPDAGAALTAALGPETAKAVMGAVAGVRDTVIALADALGNAITWFNSTDDAAVIVREGLKLFWDVLSTVVGFIVRDVIAALGKMKDALGEIGPAVAIARGVFDGFRLFFLNLWKDIVLTATGLVNGIITVLNGFIEKYNVLADVLHLPLIGKIELITPNLSDVDARINQIARDRTANIYANVYEQAVAGGGGTRMYAEGTPFVPFDMTAQIHRGEAIIPADQNPWNGGAGSAPTIIVQGSLIGLSVNDLASALDDLARQQQRRRGVTGMMA